jgi:hypothetical protein
VWVYKQALFLNCNHHILSIIYILYITIQLHTWLSITLVSEQIGPPPPKKNPTAHIIKAHLAFRHIPHTLFPFPSPVNSSQPNFRPVL